MYLHISQFKSDSIQKDLRVQDQQPAVRPMWLLC